MSVFFQFIQSNNFRTFLFLIFLGFLPTQFGKHVWPPSAYVLGQRIDYLSPTLYVTDILIILSIILSPFRFKAFRSVLFLCTMLFLSIGIYVSRSPLVGWYGLAKLVEYVLFAVAIHDLLPTKRVIFWSGLVLCSGVVVEGILAIIQFFSHASVGGLWYFLGERTFTADTPGIANASINGQLVLRPYGTFSHPNVLAAYLVIAILLILGITPLYTTTLKWMSYLVVAFATVVLVLSLSRTAISVYFLLLGVSVLRTYSWKRVSILISVGGILLLLFGLSPLHYRFMTSPIDESVVYRVQLTYAAWQMLLSHPIFGVGFDNFLPTLSTYAVQTSTVLLLQPVHNIFLLIAAETGIGGSMLSLLLIYKTYVRVISLLAVKTSHIYPFICSLVLSLIAIGGLGMTDHYLITLQQGQLLLVVILAFCWSVPERTAW